VRRGLGPGNGQGKEEDQTTKEARL
jgi:hypothetical protein